MARRTTYVEKITDHIKSVVEERGIEHILHFTPLANLPGILRHGLLSRSDLRHVDYDVFVSNVDRLDGADHAISVSISCYYPKMFREKRHRSGNWPWVILVLDPSLLWTHHCLFFRNGAATNTTKYEQGKRYGGFALERLFYDYSVNMEARKTGFRGAHDLPPSWPTFSDSEVQVMDPIHPEYFLGVWVERPEHGETVRQNLDASELKECQVVVQPFEPRICRKPYFWG